MPTTSNISLIESSTQDGEPIECYKFTSDGTDYLYTSARQDVPIAIDVETDNIEIYIADYIKRGDIVPGSQGSSTEMTVTMAKDNPVAMLYQGAPPETPVDCTIMRFHASDYDSRDIIYFGRITQAEFQDSECTLTIVLESWLAKEFPNGLYQYTCNNVLFDKNCRLKKEDFAIEVFLGKSEGNYVYADAFAKYEDGYFENGRIYFDGRVRMIKTHVGKKITLQYPFHKNPFNWVTVVPGCDKLFATCVKKFKNADNYTGFPYVPPTDSEKNPTGKGTYWMDSNVIVRDTKGFVNT